MKVGKTLVNEDNEIISDDMKDLRTKTFNEEVVVKFNKHLFGGFNKEEVENYIASLNVQFGRTEQAYKDRIDEFTTFAQMLTKERDEALELLKKNSDELNGSNAEIATIKMDNAKLIKLVEENKTQQKDFDEREANQAKNEEIEFNLSRENDLLKEELLEVHKIKDKMAGANAVFKKQLETMEILLANTEKEKNEIKENTLQTNSMIRQSEMKKSLKLSEFTEKQLYTIKRTTQNLNELITAMEGMKSEIGEFFEEIKENKFTGTIQNSK